MWELAGEAYETGWTSGQRGQTGGCPASWEGRLELALGTLAEFREGWQTQPAPLSIVLASLTSPEQPGGSLVLEALRCGAWPLSPPWAQDGGVGAWRRAVAPGGLSPGSLCDIGRLVYLICTWRGLT